MVQGFYDDDTLNTIRENLRSHFLSAPLEQSIDKHYKLATAQATVVRFKNPLAEKKEFIRLLNHYRNQDFGAFKITELDFVFNDWHQWVEKVQLLKRFALGP